MSRANDYKNDARTGAHASNRFADLSADLLDANRRGREDIDDWGRSFRDSYASQAQQGLGMLGQNLSARSQVAGFDPAAQLSVNQAMGQSAGDVGANNKTLAAQMAQAEAQARYRQQAGFSDDVNSYRGLETNIRNSMMEDSLRRKAERDAKKEADRQRVGKWIGAGLGAFGSFGGSLVQAGMTE